jgi:hypothetical protein
MPSPVSLIVSGVAAMVSLVWLAQSGEPRNSQASTAATPNQVAPARGAGNASAAGATPAHVTQLAQRIAARRAELTIAPMVVLVPDDATFLAALAQWPKVGPFPILLDDTTAAVRHDIARFVREFRPAAVVRMNAVTDARLRETPKVRLEQALAQSAGAADLAERRAKLAASASKGPLGVVVIDPADTTWMAGYVLAGFYGQEVVQVRKPSISGDSLAMGQVDEMSKGITDALVTQQIPFSDLGDTIDAITLAMELPPKVTIGAADAPRLPSAFAAVQARQNDALSVTDLLGRHPLGPRSARFAWAGQLMGGGAPYSRAARALIAANAAVFIDHLAKPEGELVPSAWLFDGYGNAAPSSGNGPFEFADYDCTAAAKVLRDAGFDVSLFDGNQATIDWWHTAAGGSLGQRRAAGTDGQVNQMTPGVDAQLIMVNSKGNSDFFDLQAGRGLPGDVPILRSPGSVVHFVHSFSLTLGNAPWSVGGRWIDRGLAAYVGSVQEPYLPAFVPTPEVARRMVAGLPLGAAARTWEGQFAVPWKVAIVGDPLLSFGSKLKRATVVPVIEKTTPVSEELAARLRAKDFASAMLLLGMSNRHLDAGRLAAALAGPEELVKLEPQVAAVAARFAFDHNDGEAVMLLASRINDPGTVDQIALDAIWHTAMGRLSVLSREQARSLAALLRPYSYARDAVTAASAIAKHDGLNAAQAWFDAARARAPRGDISQQMSALRGQIGK